jgi:hypothetical protein
VTDIAAGFSEEAFVNTTSPTKFLSAAYRLTLSSKFSNEVRGGFQFTNPFFNESNIPSDFFIGGPFLGTSTAYTSCRLDVNSNNFGRITQSYNTPRNTQFGARYDF